MEKSQIDFFLNETEIFHLEQVYNELWDVFGLPLLEVEAAHSYNRHLSVVDSHRFRCPQKLRMVLSFYATRHHLQGFGKPCISSPVINVVEGRQVPQLAKENETAGTFVPLVKSNVKSFLLSS